MTNPSLEQLLAAGVHFGHQTRRWNPKMRRFIFAERNGIHIIDLQKTLRQIELAQKLVREVVLKGESVLFVCTKRQLSGIVRDEADRCDAMFVTERWLGGMLTNFQTVKKQVRKLKELEAGSEDGSLANYTKKEQLMMSRQREKLSKYLEGIKTMTRVPGLLFIVDSKKERIAVTEANKLGIPIVSICDTNADPDLITVPIAGNDDAIRSVELITKAIADTIDEARREAPARPAESETESYVYSTDRGAEPAAKSDDDRNKRKRPRRRRAKPEALARLRTSGDSAAEGSGEPAANAGSATPAATAAATPAASAPEAGAPGAAPAAPAPEAAPPAAKE